MITFQEALKTIRRKDSIDQSVPFDVEFVTANPAKNTGGKIHDLKGMVYLFPKSGGDRNPDHFLNGTINIMPAGGGPITKIHIMLIRKVNNLVIV